MVRKLDLHDFDGDGVQEIVIQKRIGAPDQYREHLEIMKVGKDDTPYSAFTHEVGIKTPDGAIENKVKIEGSTIEISQGTSEGFEPDTYDQPLPGGGVESALFPWDTVGSRVYKWQGSTFQKSDEKAWEPKVAKGKGASKPKSKSKARGDEPPTPPAPRPPTADELLDRVYALYRKDRGVGASKPRFDFVTDVAGDSGPERVLVHDRDVVVFGKGFREGTSYAFITAGVAESKDILDATARDLTGDGKAEIILRGVLHAKASKALGGDTVDRYALLVYSIQGDKLVRIFGAETGRSLGKDQVLGAVAFEPDKRGYAIELRPARAVGWSEKTYPFPPDTTTAGASSRSFCPGATLPRDATVTTAPPSRWNREAVPARVFSSGRHATPRPAEVNSAGPHPRPLRGGLTRSPVRRSSLGKPEQLESVVRWAMALRWVALSGLGALALVACGSSSDGDGSGGASSASAGSAGTPSGGSTSAGGSGGSGGSSSGGSAGTGGSGGVTPGVGCMDRTTNHVAGTRIRPRNAVTSEGDRSWQGWHDSERDEDCSFETAADGKLRCLPYNPEARLYFVDTACSDPVVTFIDDYCADTDPDYLLHLEGEQCAENRGRRVYELGATYDIASGLYSLDNSGNCAASYESVQRHLLPQGRRSARHVVAEGQAKSWPSPGKIVTDGLVGADGLLQVRGWHDSEHGDVRCFFDRAEDGTERCLPSGGLSETQYFGAGCEQRLVSDYSTCPGDVPARLHVRVQLHGVRGGHLRLSSRRRIHGHSLDERQRLHRGHRATRGLLLLAR